MSKRGSWNNNEADRTERKTETLEEALWAELHGSPTAHAKWCRVNYEEECTCGVDDDGSAGKP